MIGADRWVLFGILKQLDGPCYKLRKSQRKLFLIFQFGKWAICKSSKTHPRPGVWDGVGRGFVRELKDEMIYDMRNLAAIT